MFKFEFNIKINKFSLDKKELEINCPNCLFYNKVFYKQIKFNDAVICRGCNKTIQLEDFMGEAYKAEKTIQKKIKDIEKIFR